MKIRRRYGAARRVEAPAPALRLPGLEGRRLSTGVSKMMRGLPTETWVIHPIGEPGEPRLQVELFRNPGGTWVAWTGSFTRAADRSLAEEVAAARTGAV